MLKLLKITVLLGMAVSLSGGLYAQTYTQTPVTISKDKTRVGGKIYYSHVVQDKQTLYSICKAYGVTIDEVCEANPELDLKNNGTKKNTIILIPVRQDAETVKVAVPAAAPAPEEDVQDGYIIHTVKWYEDINDISKKYGISVERIMQVNGLEKKKLKRRQKIRIPVNDIDGALLSPSGNSTKKDSSLIDNHAAGEKEESEEDYSFARKRDLNAVIIMPLTAGRPAGSNNMDFYCGALLAIEDLANAGISTELSVYDVVQGKVPVTRERLEEADVVIGPITAKDLATTLEIAGNKTTVVSPLDHKAASLTEGHKNFVQAPATYNRQYADLIDWIDYDKRRGDKVIVISESDGKECELSRLMDESKIEHTDYSYNILSSRRVISDLTGMMTSDGVNRILISSENEAFVNDVVRNLNLMVHNKHNVALYSPARIRSYDNIDVENLHNVNLHASSSYLIDYDDPKVKAFLLKYRALFNAEPTQFAFQGYDVTRYFLGAAAEYGSHWRKKLPKIQLQRMLQADFRFRGSGDGYINQGVRRVVYGPDFSVKIVK